MCFLTDMSTFQKNRTIVSSTVTQKYDELKFFELLIKEIIEWVQRFFSRLSPHFLL